MTSKVYIEYESCRDDNEKVREQKERIRQGYGDMVKSLDEEIENAQYRYTKGGNRITEFTPSKDISYANLVFKGVCIETFKVNGCNRIDDAVVISHGSAFVRRSMDVLARMFERVARELSNTIIIVPDYRTIPIADYSTSISDVLLGVEYANKIGLSNDRIIMWGDSSGAHTALCACLMMRDDGRDKLNSLVLSSPYLNLKRNTNSYEERKESDCTVNNDLLDYINDCFKESGIDASRLKQILPLKQDLGALPDMYVTVGTDEMVYDDTFSLMECMWKFKGNLRITVYEDMYHNFQFGTSLKTAVHAWNNIFKHMKLSFSRNMDNVELIQNY